MNHRVHSGHMTMTIQEGCVFIKLCGWQRHSVCVWVSVSRTSHRSIMLGSLVLLWLAVCLLLSLFRTHRAKNFPPGPRPFPIFGNLLQLNLKNPLADLEKLAKQYGNVYSLFIGATPAVVITGVKAMTEALVTKGADFSGRAKDVMITNAVQIIGPGMILSDYGPGWKEHRRFALMTLRNFGLGKQTMEERILGEIEHIMKPLEESVGKTMSPRVLFHNAASNIICQIIFGRRFDYDDEFITLIIRLYTEISRMVNGPWAMLYDSVPIVRCLPLPFKRVFRNIEASHQQIMSLAAEHKQTRVPGKPRDIMDCYLDELDKRGNDGSSFNNNQLIPFMLDLHFAGTDTTSNTLLTIFLYLMNHPHIQERCQQEIDQVLEGKDQASFEDRHKMPYMQAVVHEAQRISNTVPLSVFHRTTNDTELMGYTIPRDTLIIPNLSSVLSEEGQWKFPHEFNPENFLDDQGEFVKPEAFMPFSIGPRMCLGEGLARMELFLIMVTLLRRFQFVWPEDAGQPDYTPLFGVTMTPKPYRMEVRLRAAQ